MSEQIMENCYRCNVLLTPTNSRKWNNLCKPCHNKEGVDRRRDKKKRLVEEMGDKCADCGVSYPSDVYDFHHVDEKEHGINVLLTSNRKYEIILEEAKKCVMLCANCHRIRHSSDK